MRRCGILLPISSLPSPYGIGTFGKKAYDFIDFLHLAKQKYWQILPLGPTSYGDSPYQSFCAMAGNPYYIDLDILVEKGLLLNEELKEISNLPKRIDYAKLYELRFPLLEKAYQRFVPNLSYEKFCQNNDDWLDDYALFMSLKKHFNQVSWQDFPSEYKFYQKDNLHKYYLKYQKDVDFWKFIQYEFDLEWQNLKNYAHQQNVEIIGDVPIYVAMDSSDVWANPHLFLLDDDLKPKMVAGCPPDAFSVDGQLWGNPLYDFHQMKKDHYHWWIKRMQKASTLYDVIRIDHFRGFEAYYSIPYGASNAKDGKWQKGLGLALFKAINEELPNLKIIAEDLGFLTEGVYKLLAKTKYPGMKVLEFAFDVNGDSLYLPHHHHENCVVYTGTHDNMPLRAWFNSLTEEEKHFVREYIHLSSDDKVCDTMIRVALASVAKIAIIPFQDYLGLGLEARINTPAVISPLNWSYRINEEYLTKELALYLAFLTKLYRRED